MMKFRNKKKSSRKGFSLIEVTIAMAIAAVAVVTLLGMIPQGMDTMRDAGDMAIKARIHQGILGEIQLTPFSADAGGSAIDTFHKEERFYDDQGEELDPGDAGGFSHIYSARIHIPNSIGGAAPPSVGADGYGGVTMSGDSDKNLNLQVVIVEVAAVAGKHSQNAPFDWDDTENFHMISTYQTMVAKTGQDFSN